MWLTGRLAPDFKTIADFRKDNGVPIRQFVILCRNLNLFANAFVAIDGSKFKAVNNRDRNFTRAKMKRRIAEVDATIDRYLQLLAEADRQEPAEDKTHSLEDKIVALKQEMARLKKVEARMLKAPGQQISLTDPDARSMKHRGGGHFDKLIILVQSSRWKILTEQWRGPIREIHQICHNTPPKLGNFRATSFCRSSCITCP